VLSCGGIRPKGNIVSPFQKIAALAALMTGAFVFAAPADAHNDCRHTARDCRTLHHAVRHGEQERDWYLHRPSTPRERAETRALNHQELAAVIASAPTAPHRGDRSRMQYQRELREYRAAQMRYEHDMRLYAARPHDGYAPRDMRGMRDRRDFRAGSRRQAKWPEELDNDPCAPTGGQADPNIAAPVNLDGAATGLTQFNARASGLRKSCAPRRRR
jgi:hypothetical protein